MNMKRSREDDREIEALAMANCLMLLSQIGKSTEMTTNLAVLGRVFECKTCSRTFPSFQALGGHRASHKRPKLMAGDLLINQLPVKPKRHECSICGVEFALGQALGGHMRRHRVAENSSNHSKMISDDISIETEHIVSILKRCDNNSKRDLSLDLNLSLSLMPYDINLKLGR